MTPNPVKTWATAHGAEIFQPQSVNSADSLERILAWQPDLILVAAYGQILRPDLLDIPSLGCVNVHASLLPRWRGAAPIQAAIFAGDNQTGVTVMQMDPGMDTGPILAQKTIGIDPEATAGDLESDLAQLGGELISETLPDLAAGRLHSRPQNDEQATYAPRLKKEDGLLEATKPAELLARQVRAYEPWPASYFFWDGHRIVVHRAHAVLRHPSTAPGRVTESESGDPVVETSAGGLVLDEVQPAGKSIMDGKAFLNGARRILGDMIQAAAK